MEYYAVIFGFHESFFYDNLEAAFFIVADIHLVFKYTYLISDVNLNFITIWITQTLFIISS